MNKIKKIKKILLITILILILSGFVAAWLPSTPDGDTGATPPSPPSLYDSTLEIIKIAAEVDGKKDTLENSGDKISKEAEQGSNIDFEITLKNIWDQEIRNIDVEITIKDIDDGEDLDEDTDIDRLDAGETDTERVKFDLPLKVDEDTYDVIITISGKDGENNIHTIFWESQLEVKKDKHNVKFTKASLSPATTGCGGTARLDLELLNLGREEEEVELWIYNEELDLDFREDIDLDTGTDKDAEYDKSFRLNIPANIGSGPYIIHVSADYGSKRITKDLELKVENCLQIKSDPVSIKVLPPSTSETLTKLQSETSSVKIISRSDESVILFLATILFIVLAMVVFLLGVIMIQLRK